MPRVEFDMESRASPEAIIAALTNFTDQRPEIWPGLNPGEYEVFEVGETSALVREGNGGSIWAKERTDWSKPGVVRWEVVESGFCRPGSFVQADIRPYKGGSLLHITWERHPTTLGMKLALAMVPLTKGAPVKSSLKKGLDRIERYERRSDS